MPLCFSVSLTHSYQPLSSFTHTRTHTHTHSGERMNEAKHINKSLSALGNVIKALVKATTAPTEGEEGEGEGGTYFARCVYVSVSLCLCVSVSHSHTHTNLLSYHNITTITITTISFASGSKKANHIPYRDR